MGSLSFRGISKLRSQVFGSLVERTRRSKPRREYTITPPREQPHLLPPRAILGRSRLPITSLVIMSYIELKHLAHARLRASQSKTGAVAGREPMDRIGIDSGIEKSIGGVSVSASELPSMLPAPQPNQASHSTYVRAILSEACVRVLPPASLQLA